MMTTTTTTTTTTTNTLRLYVTFTRCRFHDNIAAVATTNGALFHLPTIACNNNSNNNNNNNNYYYYYYYYY